MASLEKVKNIRQYVFSGRTMLALPFMRKVTGYAINRREWSDNNE
jgi:hypothetical protein